MDGAAVGGGVGSGVGAAVGAAVGGGVGAAVGAAVGAGVGVGRAAMRTQHWPPTFTWPVLACMDPRPPENMPGLHGTPQLGQGRLRRLPPYDRQKSMPMYMPVT